MDALIYKITPADAWRQAEAAGVYNGSPDDLRDGFIHFSAAQQLRGTYQKYFAGRAELLLVAVDAERLGPALKWEESRRGEKFPHLYGPLLLGAVSWVSVIGCGEGGQPLFPSDIP